MTISKDKQVVLPVWVVSGLVAIIISGFTAWGVVSSKRAEAETRLIRVEKDVDKKVDKEVFQMVVDKLNSIEKKLDKIQYQ